MDYQILVLDLDGTLTNSKKEAFVPPHTRALPLYTAVTPCPAFSL